jgi:putative phage-type endonuclease
MNRDEFLRERMTGIGGSDAAAVLNLSQRKTVLDVYLEKRGELAPFVDNDATRWGQLLEPAVRQEYAERTGRIVTQPSRMLRHEKWPFVIGHPDGLIPDAQRGYEGKTARTDKGWGEPGTDQVPEDYVLQVQHYMLLTELPVFDIVVLIGGQDFRMYEVPADRELQELLLDAEHDVWQRVQRGEPPEPTWEHPATNAALRALYPGTNGNVIDATESDAAWRRVLEESNEYASSYKAQAETAKAHLLWRMESAAALRFPDGKCLRRREVKREGYTVEATKYIDARITTFKESK